LVSKGAFYGAVVVLVALLLFTSSAALIYYNQYQQKASQNESYVSELDSALSRYRELATAYNSSLTDYNRTLSQLATAVANLNTTTPAYGNASAALASLWASYEKLADFGGRRALVYEVRMMVDFGNGTRRWYNDSSVQPGWSGYVATLVLLDGRLQAAWYPAGYFGPDTPGEHFVSGVDGVSQTATESWFVWQFGSGGWAQLPTGADGMEVVNGTTFAWTLCGYDQNFNPTCTP